MITTTNIALTAPLASRRRSPWGRSHCESAIRIRANYDGATNSAASFTSTDSWHELLGWNFRHEHGIVQTFQPVTHQRGSRPFSGEALLIDGQLFSPHLPEELRHLPAPPRGAPEAEKIAYEAKFNQRARWRLVRHAGPDRDGVTRWRCPFCAGLLRSRQVPKTMRASRNAPLVRLPEGSKSCCSGILSAAPVELPLAQRIPYGTTAWRISMGRRQVVESVNAALKGSFVDLARGFFRVFGRVKVSVLLGFTLAAFNLERIRSFRAKHSLAEDGSEIRGPRNRSPRTKRRRGTWTQIIEQRPQAPPDAPPR